jgi:hypothetical protein
LYIPHCTKSHVIGTAKAGPFPYCAKSEQFDFPYYAKSMHMHMTAILILLASADCAAEMEMNKFKGEINADNSKTVILVSRGSFRRIDTTSLDKNKIKIV